MQSCFQDIMPLSSYGVFRAWNIENNKRLQEQHQSLHFCKNSDHNHYTHIYDIRVKHSRLNEMVNTESNFVDALAGNTIPSP